MILLSPNAVNKYGGIIIQAVEEEPKGTIYTYKSYPVFRYIGDLNKVIDFSILNIRFTNDPAGLDEIPPIFKKNEEFYVHYSIIGFATDEEQNAQIVVKIEIEDPTGEKLLIPKDLGKIYSGNNNLVTSADQFIFEEGDKEGRYKFRVACKDKLSGKICDKEVSFVLE